MQRPPVLDIQQPSQTPTRKVGASGKSELSQLRRRVHTDDSEERSHVARQVQEKDPGIDGPASLSGREGKNMEEFDLLGRSFQQSSHDPAFHHYSRQPQFPTSAHFFQTDVQTFFFIFIFLGCRALGSCSYYVWGPATRSEAKAKHWASHGWERSSTYYGRETLRSLHTYGLLVTTSIMIRRLGIPEDRTHFCYC